MTGTRHERTLGQHLLMNWLTSWLLVSGVWVVAGLLALRWVLPTSEAWRQEAGMPPLTRATRLLISAVLLGGAPLGVFIGALFMRNNH